MESTAARVFWEIEQKLYSDSPVTTAEFARKMSEGELCFEPGERFMYGASADVLGAVIEKVSGISFRDYLISEFFQPLGMKDTDFWVPAEKSKRLAKVYDYSENGCTSFARITSVWLTTAILFRRFSPEARGFAPRWTTTQNLPEC